MLNRIILYDAFQYENFHHMKEPAIWYYNGESDFGALYG